MKFVKYGVVAVALASSNVASASIWGKIKNAFNDCKYTEEEYKSVYRSEAGITAKLPEYFSGRFSESDFATKPWIREFIYVIVVDKAAKGQGAQSMRVYERGQLVHKAKVSTGRESLELKRKNKSCTGKPPKSYWSQTPTGFYTPKFLSKDHVSSSWDASMPYAIFYDVDNGLALHQVASSKYAQYLGSRASGGCTRQDEASAQALFYKVQATQGTPIPVIREDGTPQVDANGNLVYITKQFYKSNYTNYSATFPTYSALIIIEDSSTAK